MEEQFDLFWVIPHTKVELMPVGAYYRKADFGSVYVSTNCLSGPRQGPWKLENYSVLETMEMRWPRTRVSELVL